MSDTPAESPAPPPLPPTAETDSAGPVSPDQPFPGSPAAESRSSSENAPEPESPPENSQRKAVSGDDLYRRSSQYREWSFTAAELLQLKQQANEKGRLAAEKRFSDAREALLQDKPEAAVHGDALGHPELVTFDEEQKYLHFFGQQIVQICAHFNMPSQVRATAIAFFKRFYLVNSVMEYRPRNVLYTAVFLAAKSENYFIGIDSFCARIPKTSAKDILDLEFIILQALRFTLLVHHPFRPLYGFFLDFQSVLLHPHPVMYDVSIDTIGQLHDRAKRWLNDHALLSDVALLFTPPQIALAALYDSEKRITERYLKIKFLGPEENATGAAREQYDQLIRTVKKCVQRAQSEVVTSREESTKIDEKCFFSLNPAKLLKKRLKALS